MKSNKYTLKGKCKHCGNDVQRDYSLNAIKGFSLCSDEYLLSFPCDCAYASNGNVYKRDAITKDKIREFTIDELVEDARSST